MERNFSSYAEVIRRFKEVESLNLFTMYFPRIDVWKKISCTIYRGGRLKCLLHDIHSYYSPKVFMLIEMSFFIPVNHALGSYASQSNTSIRGYAYRAVDGNRSGIFSHFSCTHTPTEENPFWSVSFEPGLVNVSAVRISNRQDCCQDRLSDFEIRIGDYYGEEAIKSPKCGDLHTVSGASKVISCPNMVGRFLTIRIPGKYKTLSLCEVEVFGTRKYCDVL